MDTFATTDGGGTELGLRNRDARENGREWMRTGPTGTLRDSATVLSGNVCIDEKVESERKEGRECRETRIGGTGVRHTPSRRNYASPIFAVSGFSQYPE